MEELIPDKTLGRLEEPLTVTQGHAEKLSFAAALLTDGWASTRDGSRVAGGFYRLGSQLDVPLGFGARSHLLVANSWYESLAQWGE